ncbi:hypothetical protein MHY85_13080 [Cellulomonas sp. ACRRI]|uniref:hypothetical protein n=1 Tax=Cellulomonas sp. ACRRI TaxID=2918188 RepID=UPI001EF1CF1A|nr:hypothetical protein [Cellulomonas sp. ACRRI]MCG7286905.1 hypothetical protein [Cellulomonas sp. ACRRI]
MAVLALVLAMVLVPAPGARAAATVPFTVKFSTNANGAMTSIGNTLLTCPASTSCTSALNGAAADNNGFTMVNLDADGVAGTTNSSSSSLDLPAGASVLWAGLYWGARLQAGTGGTGGSAAAIDQMSLRAPGDAAYRTITASTATRDRFGPNPSSYNAYQRFADVTSIVQQAGNGAYWGANVAAATGQDRYAGWALTLVYSAPGLPLRNLTVFDGFNAVANGSPQSVTVSGFLAPRAGPVDAQLTMLAYEGDLAQTGDYTRLTSGSNNTQLATALSPGSNFFSSTNDLNGTSVTTRSPANRNMLGFDIKNLGASGTIPNGATSATFAFSSNGDVYYPGLVGLAISLYAPDFTTASKSVVNLSGHTPARPGDTLQYTLSYPNTGQDPAVAAVSQDVLPAGTTYVPGSLRLVPAPGATPVTLTDQVGDDRGEVDGRTVRVRLGTGATATAGGTIDVGANPSYSFRVTLADAAGGTTVTNIADLAYRTATTDTPSTYTTNPVGVDVTSQADVSLTKVMSPDPSAVGAPVQATVTVTNAGPNTATAVTMTDPLPTGWQDVAASTTAGTCATASGTVTCALGDLASGQHATITLTGTTASASTATALTNVASVTTTAFDPDPANNVAGATVTLNRQADLAISKTLAPAPANPGRPVRWTIQVTNNGSSDAQGVIVDDVLADSSLAQITAITSATPGLACTPRSVSVRCTLATLPAGQFARFDVEGVLSASLAAGTAVTNTATVASTTPDPDPSDNAVTVTVEATDPVADVRVTKTGPATVVAGQQIAWTITATNWGPSDAAGVTVTDPAPPGVTITGASTSRGACTTTASTMDCDLGTLVSAGSGPNGEAQPGASGTITLTGTVSPDATGTLSNTATAAATTSDPALGSNFATVTTDVLTEYDLGVAKTANRTALPGADPPGTRPVDYTITVTNAGPATATGVVVEDLVPTALRFDSVEVVGPAEGTCTAPEPTGDAAHDRVVCTLTTAIAPGSSAQLAVHTTAITNLAAIGDPVSETVTVQAPGDTTADNNTATWTLSGDPYVDLSLLKEGPGALTAGGQGTYTLTVTNNVTDPDDPANNYAALAPVITDRLPDGLQFVSATGAACAATGQDLTCQLPSDLPAGASAPPVQVVVALDPAVPAGTVLTNTAAVATANPETNPDSNPDNNTASSTATVTALTDIQVVSFTVEPLDPASTGPGTWRRVRLELTNNGPSTARDVAFRVERAVDAYVIDTGTQPANCTNAGREVECTLDGDATLARGAGVVIEYVIEIAPSATPTSQSTQYPSGYPDSVRISTSTPESDETNNTGDDPVIVGDPVTDLAVTKTALGTVPNPDDAHDAFVAGGAFTYQITVTVPATPTGAPAGSGYADAQDVSLRDLLPVGFAAASVSTTAGALCTLGPVVDPAGVRSLLECGLGAVPGWRGTSPPPQVVITVHGTLHPDANNLNGGDRFAEQVPNTATVTTATPLIDDGDPTIPADTRTATAAVDVVEIADLQLTKTPDTATAAAGGSTGYTLTVVNAGPSDVEHAVVFDQLPAGFALDAAASTCPAPQTAPEDETQAQPQLPPGPGRVACRVGDLDAGASATVRIVARTDATLSPGTATNTAVVGLLANDTDTDNNQATADVEVIRLTDLAITGSVSTTTPAAGQDITYAEVATNAGPSTAVDTRGVTTFPPGFVPVSWDVPFNDCTWDPPAPANPRDTPWQDVSYTLTCVPMTPGAAWEPGGAATNRTVMYIPGDTPSGTYRASSSIASDTPETVLENNTATLDVTVQHVSDLEVAKDLVEPDPLQAGQTATWRILVVNHGPSLAENVVVSDDVPAGMTYVAAQVEGGAACPPPEQYATADGDSETILRCPVPDLAPDAQAALLVSFAIDRDRTGQDLCNAVLVGSGSLDPEAGDNQAQACSAVTGPAADIATTVTTDTPLVRVGETAAFTVTVANNGPQDTWDVTAALTIPSGLRDVTVQIVHPDGTLTAASCDAAWVCSVGDLPAGAQVQLRVTGTAIGDPGGTLELAVSADHPGIDIDPDNNTDAATVVLLPAPTAPMLPPSEPGPPSVAQPPAGRLPITGSDLFLPLGALAALLLGAGTVLRVLHGPQHPAGRGLRPGTHPSRELP